MLMDSLLGFICSFLTRLLLLNLCVCVCVCVCVWWYSDGPCSWLIASKNSLALGCAWNLNLCEFRAFFSRWQRGGRYLKQGDLVSIHSLPSPARQPWAQLWKNWLLPFHLPGPWFCLPADGKSHLPEDRSWELRIPRGFYQHVISPKRCMYNISADLPLIKSRELFQLSPFKSRVIILRQNRHGRKMVHSAACTELYWCQSKSWRRVFSLLRICARERWGEINDKGLKQRVPLDHSFD